MFYLFPQVYLAEGKVVGLGNEGPVGEGDGERVGQSALKGEGGSSSKTRTRKQGGQQEQEKRDRLAQEGAPGVGAQKAGAALAEQRDEQQRAHEQQQRRAHRHSRAVTPAPAQTRRLAPVGVPARPTARARARPVAPPQHKQRLIILLHFLLFQQP